MSAFKGSRGLLLKCVYWNLLSGWHRKGPVCRSFCPSFPRRCFCFGEDTQRRPLRGGLRALEPGGERGNLDSLWLWGWGFWRPGEWGPHRVQISAMGGRVEYSLLGGSKEKSRVFPWTSESVPAGRTQGCQYWGHPSRDV